MTIEKYLEYQEQRAKISARLRDIEQEQQDKLAAMRRMANATRQLREEILQLQTEYHDLTMQYGQQTPPSHASSH